MAEWRLGRGWSERELARRLTGASRRRRNFDIAGELTPAHGWNTNRSEAAIAQERAGPPVPDGPFVRAWRLVENYAFSDPRIVKGHFDPEHPLLGRRMLLEAQALGLHYLGAVIVGDVRCVDEPGRTVRGFRYDTLEGHFEKGAEWFLVTKIHASGEVRFGIEAAWQEGDLPNAWSRLGFRLVGRHYQRAWHRLAYQRMRVMLGSTGLDRVPRGRRLVHEGPSLRVGHVHALGGRRPPPEGEVEQEITAEPTPPTGDATSVLRSSGSGRVQPPLATSASHDRSIDGMLAAFGTGAIAGARTMLAPALLGFLRPDVLERTHGGVAGMLRVPAVMNSLPLLAAGELAADKTPWIPARTGLLPLSGRLLLGALVGAAVGGPRRPLAGAAAGALGAFGSAHVLHRLRRAVTERYGLPNVAAGLVEDVLVTAAGAALLRRVR